uniref:NADH-ubiquinone oxidoreductase chain 3 n=1 Tax=Atrina pectinata TaxID=49198 RepID=L0ESS6_ATRPE|nr:NADH dehydrogenase subunit 3 [Atrina pectinata]AGA63946.1 NADH dehydrogenase subunit 3 [Atrina pectinata]
MGVPVYVGLVLSSVMVWLGGYLGGRYTGAESNKSGAYECGFVGISSAWIPFSLHFFHFALLFVIWDVEVVLLIPLMKMMGGTSMVTWSIWGFLIVLWVGLIYEWIEGSLTWVSS